MKTALRQFVICSFLVLAVLLNACNMPVAGSPTVEPAHPTIEVPIEPAVTGPAEGTLMLWVDGSTLLYIDFCKLATAGDCATPDFRWIYQSEITNYQFSICVEAGKCQLPPAEDSPSPDINNPEQANSSAQIIDPKAKQEYCAWVGGRLTTEEEAEEFEGALLPHPIRGAPLTTDNTTIIPETTPTIASPIGGDNNGLPLAEIMPGFRCVIDAPHLMAVACQTSAFYLNGPPAETDHVVTQAGQFCQTGVGYVTLDISIPDGENLQSIKGDCEVIGENRVLCSSQSDLNGNGEALILVNGLLPAVQREGLPASGQMQCLPGYKANSDSPTQCSFGELLPAVQNDSGFTTAQLQSSNDQIAGQVSLVTYQPNPMQSANLDQICPDPLTLALDGSGDCVYKIRGYDIARANDCEAAGGVWIVVHESDGSVNEYCELAPPSDGGVVWGPRVDGSCSLGGRPLFQNGIVSGCAPNIFIGCPVGTYFNKARGLCVSAGQLTLDSLAGFHFDEIFHCSKSDLPSGHYPGCPLGQAYDPSTDSCDFKNIHVDEGKVLQSVQFNFNAPSCEIIDTSGGDGGSGSSVGCTLSVAACAPKKFDHVSCSCK